MRRRSFKTYLVLSFLLAGLVPLFLFGLLGIKLVRARLQEDMVYAVESVMNSVTSEMGRYIKNARNAVEVLAGRMAGGRAGTAKDRQDILDTLHAAVPGFSSLVVLDDRKILVTLTPYDGTVVGSDFSLNPLFEGSNEWIGKDVVVSHPFIPITTGIVTVSLTKKFTGGYAVGFLRLDDLSDFLKALRLSEKDSVAVIDHRGAFLAHTDTANVHERRYEPKKDLLVGKEGLRILPPEKSGGPFYLVSRKIKSPEWTVLYYRDIRDTEAFVLDVALRFLAAGLIAGILCILFAIYFRNLFNRPLQKLLGGLGSMAEGQFEERLAVKAWKEYDAIAEAFNSMAEKLHRREEKIVQSVKEKEVLIKEVHHRVKNNLQIISSLLHLQSAEILDPRDRELLEVSQDRVRSMALIHELLYQSEDLSSIDMAEYGRRLVWTLSNAARNTNPSVGALEIALNFDPLKLNLDEALPCGLIINELVTNALKYAFTGFSAADGEKPRLSVDFLCQGEAVRLVVADNGRGLPAGTDPETSGTLGFSLVRSLTKQLRGTYRIESLRGLAVAVVFPLSVAEAKA